MVFKLNMVSTRFLVGLIVVSAIALVGSRWLFGPKPVVPLKGAPQPTKLTVQPVQVIPPLPQKTTGTAVANPRKFAQNLAQALDPKLGYSSRIHYIDRLGATLDTAEQAAILDYLQNPPAEGNLRLEEQHALRNDLINVLRNQHQPSEGLTGVLVKIYETKSEGSVMRDYAIQHLSEWRWRVAQQNLSAVAPIDQTLWDAAAQKHESFSGTALMALARIAEDPSMRDHDQLNTASYRVRLGKAARAVAADETASLPARISALGVCGRVGDQSSASVARRLAQNDANALLRVSAMHVAAQLMVGQESDPSFPQYLETQTKSPDLRIQAAAKSALALLSKQ